LQFCESFASLQKPHTFFPPFDVRETRRVQESIVNSSHFVAVAISRDWHANCSNDWFKNPLGISNGNGFANPAELQVSPPAKKGEVIQMMPQNHLLLAPQKKIALLFTCWQHQQRRFLYV
jgi:hypothetical protein